MYLSPEEIAAIKAGLEHDAPGDCWATGPNMGDPIEDLIACPGCRALEVIAQAEDMDDKDIMIEQLKHALAQTLVLQNHYASLLNTYDGGKRKIFKSINEWIQRLSDLESAEEAGL